MPDVGRLRVEREVDQFGDVVGHRGQQLQPVPGHRLDPHLQREVGDDRRQVGVARPLAVAVHAALDLDGALADGGEGVGHRAVGVVVEVGAEPGVGHGRPDRGHGLLDDVGQGAAVGVAQDEPRGAGLVGRPQDPEGELGVVAVAVEEVLGVQEHLEAGVAEELHRVADHGHGLVERRAQRLGDVVVPRLGHDAGHRGAGLDQVAQDLVVLGHPPGPARRPEGHQLRPLEAQLGGRPLEELGVLGVGARPAALDVVDSEQVELFGDLQLVGDGERDALPLRTVPQRRVVDLDPGGPGGVSKRFGHVRAIPCTSRPRL